MSKNTGTKRIIAVGRSIDVTQAVATFDEACEMLRQMETIVVGACPCRKRMEEAGRGCGKPMETCFMFGAMARYYMDHGLGRRIDFSEAVALLCQAHEAGLVLQPATARNPGGLCSCCCCCCSVLASLYKHPRPAEMVTAHCTARCDPDKCSGCETCTQRCPMDAVTINAENGRTEINRQRCIGCGLCVSVCPTGAIELVTRPGMPPEDAAVTESNF